MSSSIVFIDSRVTQPECLIETFGAGVDWVVLTADQDGLDQITTYLAGTTNLDSIQIVSHGSPGSLLIGDSSIGSTTLDARASALAQIGSSLKAGGDILLYGCNVATGDVGNDFIQTLAVLTGADVAASVDPTGAGSRRGNWQLEAQTGAIETAAIQPQVYDHLLAAPTGSVTISGTVTQGQTLTAISTLADADLIGTISYQWKSSFDGSTWNNAGTGTTLVLTEPMVGAYMLVVASYTDGSGTDESVASDATSSTVDNLNDDPAGSVSISGTATQGQTLTASNTVTDADGLGIISYQWQQQYDGTNFANISGETNATLSLTQSHVGKVLRVTALYTDGHGTSQTVASTATSAVANVDDDPTGSVSISGTISVGETLTASLSSDFADADGLGAITYTWQSSSNSSTWSALSTGSTLGLSAAHLGKYIRVVASYTDNQNGSESVTSSVTSAVTNTNNSPTGSITVDDTTPAQNQTLTATNTLADADGPGTLTITYTWQTSSDSSTWSTLTTGSTVTLAEAQVGKYIRVVASYTDGAGTSESVLGSATSVVTNVDEDPTGSVTISGTAMQGQTLTASSTTLADADGLGTLTYTWTSSDGSTLGTGTTYLLTSSEVGETIQVTATYTDGHGSSESKASSATTAVISPNTDPTGSVAISGTVTQNQTLTASNTVADADGLGAITYTWQSSPDGSTWSDLSTGKTLSLTESLVGSYIRAVAGYDDGQDVAETVASSATAAVANVNDALSGAVTISGTVSQGQTLTASNTLADADDLGTITYTWQSSSDTTTWSDVSTGTTFGLSEEQIGKYIRVKASYTDGHGTAESATSTATAKVTNTNNSPTGSVTVTGTATQGQTLTASNTLADTDTLGTITYTWQSSSNGTTWTSLTTTGTTLVLAEAQVGKYVRVLASYTDGYGTAESSASTATSAIVNVDDDPTGSVTISGNVSKGQTLTAVSTLADADGLGTISYQWQTSSDGTTWNNLSSGSTLGLSDAQTGLKIRVVASYTDSRGASESAASSATAAVGSNAAVSGSVSILGNASQGQILKAANTLADIDGLGEIVYEWQSSSDGENWETLDTGSSLTLTTDLIGKQVRVVANYTDGLGQSESVASIATTAIAKSKGGTYAGTSGDDAIAFGGTNDKIDAGAGNDTIDAGDGKNIITAGAGDDRITTGSGADRIDAGSGNDTITGGAGKDYVVLGLGADIFVFDNIGTSGADTISHFNATEDKLAFQADTFTALAGGLTADNIVIAKKAKAQDADDYLIFDTQSRKLYYDEDGKGDGKAVLLATIKVVISGVATDDFMLV